MKTPRALEMATLGAAAVALLGAAPASAQDAPLSGRDANTVAGRAAAAARAAGGDRSAAAAPTTASATGSTLAAATACRSGTGVQFGVSDYFCTKGRAYLDTLSDWTRSEIPNDYARSDDPGWLTTTVRVWGTDWMQTESGKAADSIVHTDEMTCSGVSLTGVSISGGGASASSGVTSATASRTSTVNKTWYHQFFYNQDAHWRCVASNLGPAKVTRRTSGTVNYKNGTTTPVAQYSFWF